MATPISSDFFAKYNITFSSYIKLLKHGPNDENPSTATSVTSEFFSKNKSSSSPLSEHQKKIKNFIRNKVIESKEYIFKTNRYGNTFLHCVVNDPKCQLSTVVELLEKGADVNARNLVGDTPLNMAVYANCDLSIIKMLLDRGARINEKNAFGDTTLHRALDRPVINNDVVELLLKQGARVNRKNFHGEAALHSCIRKADMDLVRLLLEYGADWQVTNSKSNTLLHQAMDSECNPEIINWLIDLGISINSKNKEGHTPLEIALLNKILTKARLDVIKLLLDSGADCNTHTNQSSLLHTALLNDTCAIDTIQMLLHYGARVHEPELHRIKDSVLHVACSSYHGSADTIRLLLANGANVDALNGLGESPLFSALRSTNGHFEKVKALLEHGASLELFNLKANNVLHVAASRSTYNVFKLLLDKGADPNKRNSDSRTPLFNALSRPDVDVRVVKLLLSKLPIRMRERSLTPLDDALSNPRCPVKVVKLLLENNFSLNNKNAVGETPMHACLRSGNMEVIRFALANHGIVTVRDRKRKYPLEHAIQKYNRWRDDNSREMVELLIKYSFLELKHHEINSLIKKCWDEPVMIKFNSDCIREINKMLLQNVAFGISLFKFLSRTEPPNAKLRYIKCDVKYLLEILNKNKYPLYKEAIADTIKRKVMVDHLNDILIYSVSKDTGEIYVLNYHCACYLTKFLSDKDLLNMLLAYCKKSPSSNGNGPICGKRAKSNNASRKKRKR